MKLTFVDAAVLIAAARGGSEQAARAMEILDDPEREFAASPFLRLEVLPQAAFNKREAEVAFYDPAITEAALQEASRCGVEAMDALHVAAAASVGAAELVTAEKPSRSIHRARAVKIVTIHPAPR
jgi:hypothetical protein